MSDLHRNSRFLRFLRSIRSKTTCVRRAIVALFVAIATILATFMIMPSASMGASQQGAPNQAQTQNGNAENKPAADKDNKAPAKDASAAKGEAGDSKTKESNTAEPKNPQPSANPDASNADRTKNVDSEKKQNTAVGDKKDSKEAKKEEPAKKLQRKRRGLGSTRADAGKVEIPEACKKIGRNTFKGCYETSYEGDFTDSFGVIVVKIQRGSVKIISPKFEYKISKTEKKSTTIPDGLWFKLEKDGKDPVPSWVNFEKTENDVVTKVQDTEGKTGFNGSLTLRPNGKWDYGIYRFKVGIYNTKKDKKFVKINVKVDVSNAPEGDLKLELYDFGKKQDSAAVSDNKITINPKSNGQSVGESTAGSTGQDAYETINKLFIDSKSTKKPGLIHHHMICHKTGSGDSDDNYTLDSVNGLSLGTQTQFKHKKGENRPDKNAENSAVYENDSYTEESQSLISGTPKDDGTFECKVFALKDVVLEPNPEKVKVPVPSTIAKEFDEKIKTNGFIKSLFDKPENNIVDDNIWTNSKDIKKGIDWDYKTITIQFGDEQKPKTDNLALNVYPFKNSDGSLPAPLSSSNNKISAMLGMELKPFVDATSAADSKNQITLRVLCKGEKKNAAAGGGASAGGAGSSGDTSGAGSSGSSSAVGGSNGGTAVGGSTNSTQSGSQSEQPSESTQPAKATWSSNPDGLGLIVPADTDQTRCRKGDKDCNVAAQTTMDVSIKPTKAGNYQCVVFALKPKALTKFDALTGDATQSGSLTPELIKSKLTNATPTAFKENKDFAAFTLNIHSVSNFTLPHTGEWNWNLQLGAIAAVMVSVLAAGFVASQNDAYRKLFYERRRC